MGLGERFIAFRMESAGLGVNGRAKAVNDTKELPLADVMERLLCRWRVRAGQCLRKLGVVGGVHGKGWVVLFLFWGLLSVRGVAQYVISDDESGSDYYYMSDDYDSDSLRRRGMNMGRNREVKKTKDIPKGLKMWNITDDFGTLDSIVIDTMPHMFQNANFTDGLRGEYNTLGNLGSPREGRLISLRSVYLSNFIFARPYDFFLVPFTKIAFTNTLSPWTNLTYNECGSNTTGEDRITAYYAINAGKDIGFGFKLDYLYGRGYYDSQATSAFGATFYGDVNKEQYKAHFAVWANYLKTSENGGIESDEYITNPESFPSSYNTDDIPTRMESVWNKMYVNGAQLTHSYSVGFRRLLPVADSIALRDSLLRASMPDTTRSDSVFMAQVPAEPALPAVEVADTTVNDTLNEEGPKRISISEFEKQWLMADEEAMDSMRELQEPPTEFIPVTSFIHTLKVEADVRRFLANEDLSDFYTNKYFECDSAEDKYEYISVSNQLAVELHEGFNKWAVMGVRLFAKHEYLRYGMPVAAGEQDYETFNEISIGACLFRHKGQYFNYDLEGATKTDGEDWGQFYLKGNAELNVKIWNDTLRLRLYADIVNQEPTYYYRKYYSSYLWWDNSLDKQITTRFGGVLENPATRTRLSVDVRNIKNYTYFAMAATEAVDDDGETYYTYDTQVKQSSGNVQVVCLTLDQDFKLGILNWENQVCYQTTSNKDVLPLPQLSLYTNLYLLFRIAKVLRVEFGADMRYFTKYYAHTYCPGIGQFAVQDESTRVKVGNHPVINVYANFHLKHTRFYVMASHVNYSKTGGNVFMAPHYPYDPFVLRFGLSWNFFN